MKKQNKQLHGTHPIFYFIVYIFIILIFALIYSAIPEQFYHSNIVREKEYSDLSCRVAREFEHQLKNKIINTEDLKYITCGDNGQYGLEVESLEVTSFDVKSRSFYIVANVLNNQPFEYEGNTAFMTNVMTYKIILSGSKFLLDNRNIIQTIQLEPTNYVYDAIKQKETDVTIDISKCFGGKDWLFDVEYSKVTDDNIMNLMKGEEGYSDGINNNFFRMLYLSVVTITTLGFGDIAPITDNARLLVGLESFIGVIIAGLFVSALFQRS